MPSERITKRMYENFLNDFNYDAYTEAQAIEMYAYIGSAKDISKAYYQKTLGTLLRKKDPLMFEEGYKEYRGRWD